MWSSVDTVIQLGGDVQGKLIDALIAWGTSWPWDTSHPFSDYGGNIEVRDGKIGLIPSISEGHVVIILRLQSGSEGLRAKHGMRIGLGMESGYVTSSQDLRSPGGVNGEEVFWPGAGDWPYIVDQTSFPT